MEDTLRACVRIVCACNYRNVLILVLMEDTLREKAVKNLKVKGVKS